MSREDDIAKFTTEGYYSTLKSDELIQEITDLRNALTKCHRLLKSARIHYPEMDLHDTVAELVGDLDGD